MDERRGAAEGLSFGDIASVIWRERLILVLAAVVALVGMQLYISRLATPLYVGTTVVALEGQTPQIATGLDSVLPGASTETAALNTEAVVMRSRLLIGDLVDRLELARDPEFNPALRTRAWYSPRGLLGGGTRADPDSVEMRTAVVDAVRDAVSVSNLRQSYVFNISVQTSDPAKSADMANMLALLYTESQVTAKFEANKQASTFLSARSAELKQTLEQLEASRNAFFERDRTITPEALAAASAQLRELRARMGELEAARAEEAAVLDQLRTRAEDPEAFAIAADDVRLTQTLRRRGATDRLVLDTIQTILARRAADLERVNQQIAALRGSEAALDAQVARQGQELIELQQLERELEATRLLYESFLTRLKETNVQQGLETPDSRILSMAVSRPPVKPRKMMLRALALMLGLGAAAGFVLLRELRFSGFRTMEDLRGATGVTVMGSVPMGPTKTRPETIAYMRDKPNSVLVEAVRNLRTSILMSDLDTPPKVILLTSSVPGEGKTTLSMALAMNMMGLGKKVLLIEADIRRRTFGEYFDTSNAPSLLEALERSESLTEKDLSIPELGVDVLVGSKSGANAADVFSSERFKEVLAAARTAYDLVIIDSPPVLAVPDARVIRPHCDACVYVVRWNATTRLQVNQGLQMFSALGQDVTGLALSQVDAKQMARYGYAGEYGYDSTKGGYYDN